MNEGEENSKWWGHTRDWTISSLEEHKTHKIIPESNTNFAHCSFCNSSMLLSYKIFLGEYFAVVQSLSHVRLFTTPWTAASQASLFFTISQSLLKLMYIELVMPSNHLILCCPLLLLPSIFPSIRVFSSESAHPIRWPKYCSFSFSINPSSEYSGLISFRNDWLDLLVVKGTVKSLLHHCSSKASILWHSAFLWSSSHIHTWLLEKP